MGNDVTSSVERRDNMGPGLSRRPQGGPREVMFAHTSTAYGGMEVYVERLAARLDRDRWTPALFVTLDPYAVPQELVANMRDLGVPIVEQRPTLVGRASAEAARISSLATELRRRRSALVHVNTSLLDKPRLPFVASTLVRTPVVRTDHLPPPDPDVVTKRLRREVRMLDAVTDRVVLVSHANRDAHVEVLHRDPQKLVVLQNGVDLGEPVTADDRESAKRALSLDPDIPLVGTVGRLSEQKGHRDLLVAMRSVIDRLGPVNLAIVGEGPLHEELREIGAALGLGDQLIMPGHVHDPERWVAAFDVAVLPSRYEGFSLSMLEFMAAGKPCVFSDHPSFVEATGDGRVARLARMGDPVSLADEIVGLLADPAGAELLGRAAREHVAGHFTIDGHVSRLMDLYDASAR
jgi:glycosyltransferase involved in cell wall biosynthesis